MPRKVPEPFDPGHLCPACAAEGGVPSHHYGPIFIVFGSGPDWPCTGTETGEHLCIRCPACGYGWVEAVASPPEDLIPVELPIKAVTGGDMTIRKHGTAEPVTDASQAGIIREPGKPWDGKDDEELAAENAEPGGDGA